MRVFVTGGSGFLGRQIVARARAEGHDVLAPRSAECDLTKPDSLARWFDEATASGGAIDAVIHSAAYYGGLQITMTEPATILHRNSLMITNLFAAAAEAGVDKIVGVGSACGYPGSVAGDMHESDFWAGPLHASVEGYGFTKKLLLVNQNAYHRQHGIEGNHIILTNLYGPHDVFTEYRGHAISVLIKRYVDAARDDEAFVTNWGDGSAVREFLHVEDAAEVIVGALEFEHDLTPINVGTGVGTSIRALCELIEEFSGFAGDTRWDTDKPNGAPRKVLATDRLERVLPDFEPRSLRDGLAETVAWYRENYDEANARR